jgi:hypothetical protein
MRDINHLLFGWFPTAAAGRCETEAEALVRGLVETEVLTPTPDPAELPSLLSG